MDGGNKAYSSGGYYALLLRSTPDEKGQFKDWLVAMNNNLDDHCAETIADWCSKQLQDIGLSAKSVHIIAGDNTNTMPAVGRKLGAQFEGCCAHLVDLVMDEAWELIHLAWPSKVQKIISSYQMSDNMERKLTQHQEEANIPVLGLIAWNATRWQGKERSTKRLNDVSEDSTSRDIIGYDLTDSETQSMKDVLPILTIMATLTSSLTKEEGNHPPMATPLYGGHYRLIQHAYFLVLLHLASMKWEERDAEQAEVTRQFGMSVLEGLEKRFLTTASPAIVAGYVLEKGDASAYGFGSMPNLELLFNSSDRMAGSFAALEEHSDIVSEAQQRLIFTTAAAAWGLTTPLTSANVVASLKLGFRRVYERWQEEFCDTDSVLSALSQFAPSEDSPAQTVSSTPFETMSSYKGEAPILRLLRRGKTNENAALLLQLSDEYENFKKKDLHLNLRNSLEWACDPGNNDFSLIRYIIKQVLPRPFSTTAVEQVFSHGVFQTSKFDSSLNSTDFETRMIIAYNRKHYSFQDFCAVIGLGPYLFKHHERKRALEAYANATSAKIGFSQRRTTDAARAKQAEILSTRKSNLASPHPVTPYSARKLAAKRKSPTTAQADIHMNEDEDIEDFETLHFLATAAERRRSQLREGHRSIHTDFLIDQVERVLNQRSEDSNNLRVSVDNLCKTTLSDLTGASDLRLIIPTLRDNQITEMLKGIVTGLRNGQSTNHVIPLLLVPYRGNVEPVATVNEFTEQSTHVHSSNDVTLLSELTAFQDGLDDQSVFEQASAQSWKEFVDEQNLTQETLKALEGMLKRLGAGLFDVPADGSCLYHAIFLGLQFCDDDTRPSNVLALRSDLCDWMEEQDESWFELPPQLTKSKYLEGQRRKDEWGDINVVRAAAMKYKRTIIVHAPGQETRTVEIKTKRRGRPYPGT